MERFAVRDLIETMEVPAGKKISLRRDFDPAYTPAGVTQEDAEALLAESVRRLAKYQEMLYAQDNHAVLVVLQAMDAAGKDGVIKHVMTGLNPQGCQVYSFKAPSNEELDHDYMWRCFRALPERGRIGIFNRSYYEEVLIARVHPEILERQKLPLELKNKKIWKRRYEEIRNFEKYLTDNGIHIVKIFLHISKEEQRRRFLARIERPEKNWKFSAADAAERAHWDEYMRAYQLAFRHTSTEWAPWHVVPADHKWFARVAVAGIIYKKLKSLKLKFPTLDGEQRKGLEAARELLESEGDPTSVAGDQPKEAQVHG